MKIVCPKEIFAGEHRVDITPETAKKFTAAGFQVCVETGAGNNASFLDRDYEQVGAQIQNDLSLLYQDADIILKVRKPAYHDALSKHEIELFKEGSLLISFLQPSHDAEVIEKLQSKKISVLAMELVPRIARAQKLDALSSQSNIAGYKAVLLAANQIQKVFPMMITAAGTIQPARVLVLGAGVAGLQAIATAKRLGAVVEAFDTRPVVKEQVESLGGKFIEFDTGNDSEDKGGYAK